MEKKKEKVLPIEQHKVCPAHPGEILKELYIDGLNISVEEFCIMHDLNVLCIQNLIKKNISCSIMFQCKLARATNTTSELWENLQADYDKWMEVKG